MHLFRAEVVHFSSVALRVQLVLMHLSERKPLHPPHAAHGESIQLERRNVKMQTTKIRNSGEFSAAVVPKGMVLIFYAVDEKGKTVKQYKDSNGNFGSM